MMSSMYSCWTKMVAICTRPFVHSSQVHSLERLFTCFDRIWRYKISEVFGNENIPKYLDVKVPKCLKVKTFKMSKMWIRMKTWEHRSRGRHTQRFRQGILGRSDLVLGSIICFTSHNLYLHVFRCLLHTFLYYQQFQATLQSGGLYNPLDFRPGLKKSAILSEVRDC